MTAISPTFTDLPRDTQLIVVHYLCNEKDMTSINSLASVNRFCRDLTHDPQGWRYNRKFNSRESYLEAAHVVYTKELEYSRRRGLRMMAQTMRSLQVCYSGYFSYLSFMLAVISIVSFFTEQIWSHFLISVLTVPYLLIGILAWTLTFNQRMSYRPRFNLTEWKRLPRRYTIVLFYQLIHPIVAHWFAYRVLLSRDRPLSNYDIIGFALFSVPLICMIARVPTAYKPRFIIEWIKALPIVHIMLRSAGVETQVGAYISWLITAILVLRGYLAYTGNRVAWRSAMIIACLYAGILIGNMQLFFLFMILYHAIYWYPDPIM